MDVGDRGRGIDIVDGVAGLTPEQRLANARLIAAAPELLQALQTAKQALAAAKEAMPMNWEASALCEQAEDIADAAIAKATGEQA
jgi:hypothetical protein